MIRLIVNINCTICLRLAVLAVFIFVLLGQPLSAQSKTQQRNIVPNGSFEDLANPVIGWFYKGSDFSKAMKFWSSPTEASPDIYGSNIRVPKFWRDRGFGSTDPLVGKHSVGLTLYGCKEGKPHCREYIQIRLSEPLVIGQTYQLSFLGFAASYWPRD